MTPTQQWARNFQINETDVDFLVNYMLEKETPLSSQAIGRLVVERHLQAEVEAIAERYQDVRLYSPAESYAVGDAIVHPAFDLASATITATRTGNNPQYGDFTVLTADFEDGTTRELAADFQPEHKLSTETADGMQGLVGQNLTVDDILEDAGDIIDSQIDTALAENDTLVVLAKAWFPRDLIIEADEGHLNLAEAVIDMMGGEPLPTATVLEQIGGISTGSPQSLQVFSMNYAMNNDKRFVEVGPTGEVLWTLRRMQPESVQQVPKRLRYTPTGYDRSLLSDEALALEREIGDEWSDLQPLRDITQATVTLIYPHRREGTLPLNYRTRAIFPAAQRTDTIYVTLVDTQDDEEYTGWVVPAAGYVYGLLPIYGKYEMPIGGFVHVERTAEDRVNVTIDAHRARSEWVRLLTPKGDNIGFENTKRGIGAEYDDLTIVGIDELEAVDKLTQKIEGQGRTLPALLRQIIPELGRLTPQGTAHVKTIYSAINVMRRSPPGPIMAMLAVNPDFEDMGGNYWRLSDI